MRGMRHACALEQPLAAFGLVVLSPLCFNPHLELFVRPPRFPQPLSLSVSGTSPSPSPSLYEYPYLPRILSLPPARADTLYAAAA